MTQALLTVLCCLGILVSGMTPVRAQDWEVVNVEGRDYVTLRSFCGFYGFDYFLASSNAGFSARNKNFEFRIPRGDAREVFLNGVHYWLSFPVTQNSKDWLISRIDVVDLFEPILRPHRIAEHYRVKGVVIDPGHGGPDNGATSHIGTFEKNYTLDTAFRLEKILREQGWLTVLTRRSDIFIPLEERTSIASRYRDYIFVSLHYNFATESAHGLETYAMTPRGAGSTDADGQVRLADYQRLAGNSNDVFNLLLGHEIHRSIIQLNPHNPEADRGLKRARFVVLKDNTLPAVLVEGGFLTNRMEATVVDRPSYRQALAAAIAEGIQHFVQEVSPDGPPTPPTPTPAPALVQNVQPAARLKVPDSEPTAPDAGPKVSVNPPPGSAKPTSTPVTPSATTSPGSPSGTPSPSANSPTSSQSSSASSPSTPSDHRPAAGGGKSPEPSVTIYPVDPPAPPNPSPTPAPVVPEPEPSTGASSGGQSAPAPAPAPSNPGASPTAPAPSPAPPAPAPGQEAPGPATVP